MLISDIGRPCNEAQAPMVGCMGNFYTNLNLDQDYSPMLHAAITSVIPSGKIIRSPGWTTVCSSTIEQDVRAAKKALAAITKQAGCRGVLFLNHDDSVLLVSAAISGEMVFSYDSAPGYFSGDDAPRVITGLERLSEFDPQINLFRLSAVLNDDDVTFAIERHERIVSELRTTPASIGASEDYLDNEELPTGVDSASVIDL